MTIIYDRETGTAIEIDDPPGGFKVTEEEMHERREHDYLRKLADNDNKVEQDHQLARPDGPLNVVSTGKSEADRAAGLKGRAQKLFIELCVVMDEGLREGLLIRFAGVSTNPFTGKYEVVDLHIEKRF